VPVHGRGADADIVAFDPATVRDEASFAEPMRRSRGVAEVLVSGVSVVRAGALDKPSSRARRPDARRRLPSGLAAPHADSRTRATRRARRARQGRRRGGCAERD
jgi:N-acyl-D-aspartate/D-glutamate deacylase